MQVLAELEPSWACLAEFCQPGKPHEFEWSGVS